MMADIAMSEQPLRATLYELGLNSDKPARLEAFYADALGYHFRTASDARIGIAHDRRLTISEGAPKSLAYAAFAVANEAELEALKRRLRTAGASFDSVNMDGLEPGAIALDDPDGNHFRFGVARIQSWDTADPASDRRARIQHVVFASTQVQQLLAFYTDVVGFTLSDRVEDENAALRTAFLRCSHEHHSLAVFAASEVGLDHHCYEVVDWNLIRDWGDHFAKRRIPVKWGPGRHGPGDNLFLFVHDPDGNWVEISAELEHVEADRPVGTWPHEEYTLNKWGAGFLRS